jgi:hypothetical protein
MKKAMRIHLGAKKQSLMPSRTGKIVVCGELTALLISREEE